MTVRELYWFSNAKQKVEWNYTAQLQAFIYNSLTKGARKTLYDFHPLIPRKPKVANPGAGTEDGSRMSLAEFCKRVKDMEAQ